MAAPKALPAGRLTRRAFLDSLVPDDLVYFLCNVGDGDTQLVLLPAGPGESARDRRAIVVDVATTGKLLALIDDLVAVGQLDAGANGALADDAIALAVATHPHQDHIGGMAELLKRSGPAVAEFWDPGYYHTSPAYHAMMAVIEDQPGLLYAQPTSGLRRWIGNAAVTVLSPSIQLRNRFDTYGVNINDSSLALRIEFPAARVVERDEERNYVARPPTQSLVLGADAQTLSWSYVAADFPYLHPSESAAAAALRMATGTDMLRTQVLKVSHHGSKHGVNLELVERMAPRLTLVSCVRGSGKYRFPHTVAQELVREALEPSTTSGKRHKDDYELGVFYTSDVDTAREPAGSIAVVMGRGRVALWRFRDTPGQAIDFDKACEWA
jgi:hypothetical protein